MKAVTYTEYGTPAVLRITEEPIPAPGATEVLVQVVAAAVNPLDGHLMRGRPYLGRVAFGLRRPKLTRPGRDLAGRVVAVGSQVTQFAKGDEVFGAGPGSFAEFVCASESTIVAKPANLGFEQAAAVPVAALTALQGLRDRGRLQAGQKVLVVGAGGGIGSFAVQIAKALGAEVSGVCSARNVELVRSLGAVHVLDYARDDFARGPHRYDVILDTAGVRTIADCRRALTRDGTLVLAGGLDHRFGRGPIARMLTAWLMAPFVTQKLLPHLARMRKDDLHVLQGMLADGRVVPVLDRVYPMAEVAEAVRHQQTGHTSGKIVLRIATVDRS